MKAKQLFASIMLVGILVSALALAFPTGKVAAQGVNPPAGEKPVGVPDTARLERAYQQALKATKAQSERLDRMEERAANVKERIAGLKADGKDVSALEDALAAFLEKVASARETNAEAAAILSAHAGFDANGKVTDAALARETVKEAGKLLRDGHRELQVAPRALLRVLREFRRDNR